MAIRIAALSDVHGNLLALEAVRKAIKREKPDVVLVAGDLVMNGPVPGATVDAIRDMEREGAIVVQGNTDIAVADGDYAAAFPWYFDSGVPESMKAAATSRVLARNSFGSCHTVMACMSTTQKMHSYWACSRTQFRMAPR